MEVILLERVAKLGQMGEVVRVKDGFARNFLLKRGKGAARYRRQPLQVSTAMKAELEANNIKAKGEASKVAEKINGRNVVVLRQASETGQLFGSSQCATSSRRSKRWRHHQPQPGHARRADQDHRQALDFDRGSSGSRG